MSDINLDTNVLKIAPYERQFFEHVQSVAIDLAARPLPRDLIEVIDLQSQGQTVLEVAGALGLSATAVWMRNQALMRECRVSSLESATSLCISLGLISVRSQTEPTARAVLQRDEANALWRHARVLQPWQVQDVKYIPEVHEPIFRKLGATSFAHATRLAYEKGIFCINSFSFLGPRANLSLEDSVLSIHDDRIKSPLSQRQFQVLELLSYGLTNKEVGEYPGVGLREEGVVSSRKKTIHRLQAANIQEAVYLAHKVGLLVIEPQPLEAVPSPSDRYTLEQFCHGLERQAAAAARGLSKLTIKSQRDRLYTRLKADSPAHLTRRAIEARLVA